MGISGESRFDQQAQVYFYPEQSCFSSSRKIA
jgi:hypothetical protein